MPEKQDGVENLSAPDGVTLIDYCRVVWKYRKLIGTLCVASLLVSLVYTLMTPKLYIASAAILAPLEVGIGQGGQLSISVGGDGGRTGGGGISDSAGLFSFNSSSPNKDTYMALLKSRTMKDEVIEHFKKARGANIESQVGEIKISALDKTVMTISVESQDPKLAAEIANFHFEHLSDLLGRRTKRTTNSQLTYYEKQLDRTKGELGTAQNSLIEFQEKNRYIGLDAGTKGAIAAGATQAGVGMALEMERNVKRMYLTEQHPEMIALDRRIYESKKLLSHQLYGEPQSLPPESAGSPARKEYFVATANMTPLQFRLAEVYRNLKFREALANYIIQNIESLKYNSENPSGIYVDWLDPAIPPASPSKPNIFNNVVAAAVAGLVIGIFISFFLEYLERMKVLGKIKTAWIGGGMRVLRWWPNN